MTSPGSRLETSVAVPNRIDNKASINYNVVFPLGDLVFGTYYTELPIDKEPEDIRREFRSK